MHQVNGIYMEDKVRRLEVPIGYVSHIDVNAPSLSFWCFESEQNTQSPTSSPHLIVICHLDICRISYSKTYQTCRLFFKGPAFVKSGLASMLEVSSAQLNVSPATTINNISTNAAVSDDEEGSYNILVALKEGEFPNLQNSMRGQLHIMKLKASSHSPVKPPKPSHGAPPGHAHLSTRSIHEKVRIVQECMKAHATLPAQRDNPNNCSSPSLPRSMPPTSQESPPHPPQR